MPAIEVTPIARSPVATRLRLAALGIAFSVLNVPAASGHIQPLVGKLVDLVRRSDLVVIGVVTPASTSSATGTFGIQIERTLYGPPRDAVTVLPCPAALGEGRRYVVFLAWEADHWRCVQPSGTRFPVTPSEDAAYAQTVQAIEQALGLSAEEEQIVALRAALIPALRAPALELRYHAALDLIALTHPEHALRPEERDALVSMRAAPDLDPALKPMLDRLVGAQ